jgi:undecaprenyl-diphosphatase
MTDISLLGSALLGVVEGATEFLPISSTAHLKIAESILGYKTDDKSVVAFTAVIQTGAIAAVVVYFFHDIVRIVGAWFRGLANPDARADRDYRFAWWVIFATIPLVIVGVAAKSLIDGPLASLWIVFVSLLAGSAYIWFAEQRSARLAASAAEGGPPLRDEGQSTFRDAMTVGSSQILALLLPGFSRSGASISTGLVRGLDRVAATRLSFFLSIPALVGAGAYELKDAVGGGIGAGPLIVGTVTSFVVAYAVVAWLLWFVSHYTFRGFVVYRVVLAVVLLVALASGAMNA